MEFLVNFFNRLLRGEKIPNEWRRSVLVPLYKGKGDIRKCGNYQGIKLRSHIMKLLERIIEARIRKEVTIAELAYAIWVHARKEYHRCNRLSKDAVGKVD